MTTFYTKKNRSSDSYNTEMIDQQCWQHTIPKNLQLQDANKNRRFQQVYTLTGVKKSFQFRTLNWADLVAKGRL